MKLQMRDTGGEDPRLRSQLTRDEPGDYEKSERNYCRSCGMNAGLLEEMIRRVIREELADRPVAGENQFVTPFVPTTP